METKAQRLIRYLLKQELSKPVLVDEGRPTERIEWTLFDGRYHREFGPAIVFKQTMTQEQW